MGKRITEIRSWAIRTWEYCAHGVWTDPRKKWWITVIKTLNLSVRSFLSADVQSQASAMTYRTFLALVPALALMLAIARGFGFQSYVEDELYKLFPAQKTAITYAWNFVDSYLNQSSEGIFVGVGIVFLLYTLISLISSVEDTFNSIWNVKQGRSFWRKISDYTSLILILPILVICVSGINILLSTTLSTIATFDFLTPVISLILEITSWVLTILFFSAVFLLFPNTHVKPLNALVAGTFAGVGFLVLQWLFVTGQMYVSRYNAIYGSFSFLPLLLIWMQLVWVITLAGAVVCYSSQNIFSFSFDEEIRNMAPLYRRKTYVAVAAVVTQRFGTTHPAVTVLEIAEKFGIPARLASDICAHYAQAGVFAQVVINAKKSLFGYQLSQPVERMTIGYVLERLNALGLHGFIPLFSSHFPGVESAFAEIKEKTDPVFDSFRISELKIDDLINNKAIKTKQQ